MSLVIFRNEASANSRTVPMRLFTSNGTAPDTGASNDSVVMSRPSGTTFVPNVLVAALHAAQGMYFVTLNSSDVSLAGTTALWHTQGDFSQHVANISVVDYNPFDNARLGLSNITVPPGTYSNVTFAADAQAISGDATAADNLEAFFDGTGYTSAGSVGVVRIAAGTYSGVTVGSAATILAGTYSGVTVGINNIAAGTYSGVTVGSAATILAGTYSGVTVGINDIAAGSYSGVTVGSRATILAGGILASSFAASAIDAAALSVDAGQEIADRVLLRGIAGGTDSARSVGQALYVLRNRVDASSSIGTVFQTDDTTSAWTFSNTTGAFPISSVDPA